MQTDVIKTVFVVGLKAVGKMTDCVMELLPEETNKQAKIVGTCLLKAVHEVTGDMLSGEQHGEEAARYEQTEIIIE